MLITNKYVFIKTVNKKMKVLSPKIKIFTLLFKLLRYLQIFI